MRPPSIATGIENIPFLARNQPRALTAVRRPGRRPVSAYAGPKSRETARIRLRWPRVPGDRPYLLTLAQSPGRRPISAYDGPKSRETARIRLRWPIVSGAAPYLLAMAQSPGRRLISADSGLDPRRRCAGGWRTAASVGLRRVVEEQLVLALVAGEHQRRARRLDLDYEGVLADHVVRSGVALHLRDREFLPEVIGAADVLGIAVAHLPVVLVAGQLPLEAVGLQLEVDLVVVAGVVGLLDALERLQGDRGHGGLTP